MSSGNPAFEAAQVAAVGMPAGSEATPKGGPGTGVALEERGGKSQYRGMRRGTVDFIRSSLTGLSSGMGRMQRVALISAGVGMALLAANFGLTIFSIEITKDTQVASGALVDKSTGSAVSTLQETRATRLTDLDFGEDMLMQTRISFTYEDGTRARYDVLGVQIAPVGALDESRRVALLRTLEGTFKVVEGDPEPQLLSDDEVPRLADEDVRAELAENATDATTAAGRALLGRNRPPPRSSKGCGHSPAFCRMLPECCPCNCPGGGSQRRQGKIDKFVKKDLAERQCGILQPDRKLLQIGHVPSYCEIMSAAFYSSDYKGIAVLESKVSPATFLGHPAHYAQALEFILSEPASVLFAVPGMCESHTLCDLAQGHMVGHKGGYSVLKELIESGVHPMDIGIELLHYAQSGGHGLHYFDKMFEHDGHIYAVAVGDALSRLDVSSRDFFPVFPLILFSDAPCVTGIMHSGEGRYNSRKW